MIFSSCAVDIQLYELLWDLNPSVVAILQTHFFFPCLLCSYNMKFVFCIILIFYVKNIWNIVFFHCHYLFVKNRKLFLILFDFVSYFYLVRNTTQINWRKNITKYWTSCLPNIYMSTSQYSQKWKLTERSRRNKGLEI